MRVKWDQARAKELWLEGKSDREIARAVGATKAAVTTWRQRVGLTRASSAPADEAPEPPAPESAAAEGGSGPDETGPGGPVAMTLELCGGYAELRAPGFKEARRLLLMMGWSLDAMEGGWPDE